MIFLGIIVSIILFSIIVILHEYGHYKTAKIFGIHVEEFGLGIPPRAKKLWKNKDGTLFSLNWIPLGGFVKIAGENEQSFSFYTEKGKLLSLKQLEKKLEKHEDIYDIHINKISPVEKKFIHQQLKNLRPGHNFFEKNIFQKTAVLLAGVIMNFLLAGLIFSVLFLIGVKPVGINSVITTELPSKIIPTLEQSLESGILKEEVGILLYPIENSLAETSGIFPGDILLSINGEAIETIEQAQSIINQSANKTIILNLNTICSDMGVCVASGKRNVEIQLGDDGKIGSYLSPNYVYQEDFIYQYNLLGSLKYGFLETYYQSRLTLSGLSMLLQKIFNPQTPEERQEALDQVAGPIGIVSVITQSITGGLTLIIILGAIISVNLGVFNLLPIPALDGGRIALLWIRSLLELIFGKRSSLQKIENFTHVFFFLLLIALSILIAYNDIIKLF